MKQPSLSRRRRPTLLKKLKLVCSFDGAFQRRPPSGELRYVGGETRIVSVDRNIGFLRLRSKISELCPWKPFFSLKYQLPESEDTPLVSVASDDDVRCMVEEFDKLELYGKPPRLWVFVCYDNDALVNGTTDISLKFIEIRDSLNTNVEGFCGKNGINGRRRMSSARSVGGLGENLCENGNESQICATHICKVEGNAREAKNLSTGIAGVRQGDEFSLRRMVLKQQFLSNQSKQTHRFCGKTNLDAFGNGGEFTNGDEIQERPLVDLSSEPQVSMTYGATNQSFEGTYRNAHLPGSQNSGNLVQFPASPWLPLNPRDGNLHVGAYSSAQYSPEWSNQVLDNWAGIKDGSMKGSVAAGQFPKQSHNMSTISTPTGCIAKNSLRNAQQAWLTNVNRENIMPWPTNCSLVKSPLAPPFCHNHFVGSAHPQKPQCTVDGMWGSVQSGIRNHRFGVSDARNQRICSYYMRNHRNNLDEIGNTRSIRLDGRPVLGKCHSGLRPSSNISKQGLSLRFYHPNSWKAWYNAHDRTSEGKMGVVDSSVKIQQMTSLNVQCSYRTLRKSVGLEIPQHGETNSVEYHLTNHGACASMGVQSPLPCHGFENSSPHVRAMNTQADLLTGSSDKVHNVPYQGHCGSLHGVPMINCKPINCAMKKEPHLMNPQDVINAFDQSIDLTSCNITESGCKGKLLDMEAGIKSAINHHTGTHALKGDAASSVDVSLYNLSLSVSKKEVEPQALSILADPTEKMLKPQPNLLDLMDEGHPSPGPQVEILNAVSHNFTSQTEAKLRTHLDQEDHQQECSTSLSINKKVDNREIQKCFKIIDGIPSDLAAFYTHLATRELQAIKNSDLEYIKELGSGTYGTVFYGKWKGSDVAIKTIKPSRFTDDAAEEDRLVADFWKEANILGQLHHPNIVALYGVVSDGPVKNLATVTEYMVNGSLNQVLQRKDRTIDRRKRLIIAMDAAFGMEYLHEKNIVHFDLKSHNFLVNMKDPQRPVCKIGDLGLSKIKQKTLISGGVRGTIPWMAPELLNSNIYLVTEKIDVYSFGIVMWELLTGEEPYKNMRSEEIIAGIIKGNLRPEIPGWCDPAWRSLMERCWSSDPNSRPAFSEIAKELRSMSAAMNIK